VITDAVIPITQTFKSGLPSSTFYALAQSVIIDYLVTALKRKMVRQDAPDLKVWGMGS